MSDLRELYQEVILDHCRKPRNLRELGGSAFHADGYNPLCGDKITVYVETDGETIRDISFKGSGCAISMAAASLMTEALAGKTADEARRMFEEFHEMVTGREAGATPGQRLGKLVALRGVREFPVRIKCATLAWHTMRAALENKQDTISTE